MGEWVPCENCGGTGLITHCPDDLCQGEAGCIHGGNLPCPECHGTGDIYIADQWDFDKSAATGE